MSGNIKVWNEVEQRWDYISQGISGYSGYSGSEFVGSSGYSGISGYSGYAGNILQNLTNDLTWSGITQQGTSGQAVSFGELLSMHSDGNWYKVDANLAISVEGDSRKRLAMSLTTNSGIEPIDVLLYGKIRKDAFDENLPVGGPVYASEIAGSITGTQPTTPDVVIRIIGFGDATKILYFCPSNDYITHN